VQQTPTSAGETAILIGTTFIPSWSSSGLSIHHFYPGVIWKSLLRAADFQACLNQQRPEIQVATYKPIQRTIALPRIDEYD